MYKVTVVSPFHEAGMQMLRDRRDIELTVVTDYSPEGIAKGVAGADAVTIRTQKLPGEILALAPDLRIVSRHGVGFDNVDVAYLSSRKIPMALAVDSNYSAVVEHTLMMMLVLAKNAMEADAAVRGGNFDWRLANPGSDLQGKRILILGYGRIGKHLAPLCRAFDMEVLVYDPYAASDAGADVKVVSDFRAVLPDVDYISIHTPSTPETVNMIGAAELAMMRKTAFIVNCARGGLVNEDELAAALEKGMIQGVGMDVFLSEPPDHTHPLFKQKRCVFSPHNAALTTECNIRMAKQSVQNVFDCLDGKLDPRVVVNRKEIGM